MKDLEALYNLANAYSLSQELVARNPEHFTHPNKLAYMYSEGIADPDDELRIITESLVLWLLWLYDHAYITLGMFMDGFRVVDSIHAQQSMTLYAYLFTDGGDEREAA